MPIKLHRIPTRLPKPYCRGKYRQAWFKGYHHARGIARDNEPQLGDNVNMILDWGGIGNVTVKYYITAENIRQRHQILCYAAEEHSRCYSPFECTASEFNNDPDCDRLWEAFEDGIDRAINDDLAAYTDEDYGITDD